jgi:hypothetical protein
VDESRRRARPARARLTAVTPSGRSDRSHHGAPKAHRTSIGRAGATGLEPATSGEGARRMLSIRKTRGPPPRPASVHRAAMVDPLITI